MSAAARKRRLVAIWGLLVVLVAVIVVIRARDQLAERAEADAEYHGTDRAGMVLPVQSQQLGAVEIAIAGVLHRFERDAAGAWLYHAAHAPADSKTHSADPAAAARIAQAFQALGKAKFERSVPFKPQADDYGVTRPKVLILAYAPGQTQPLVQYAAGDMAPDGASQYVLPVGSDTVRTLPAYHVDNLVNLVKALTSPGPPPEAAKMPGGLPEPAPRR